MKKAAKKAAVRYLALVRMKASAKAQLTPEGVALYFPDRLKSHHLYGKSEWFVFMGEIPNQPGHCVVMKVTGAGLPLEPTGFHHTNLFEEVPEDEV